MHRKEVTRDVHLCIWGAMWEKLASRAVASNYIPLIFVGGVYYLSLPLKPTSVTTPLICAFVCVYVCLCVCVRERERGRERGGENELINEWISEWMSEWMRMRERQTDRRRDTERQRQGTETKRQTQTEYRTPIVMEYWVFFLIDDYFQNNDSKMMCNGICSDFI